MVKRLLTMPKTRVQSLGLEDPLAKEMTTHSSTLAWKIPWTEERGRLQSMGSQRVGHDWATPLTQGEYSSGCYLFFCQFLRVLWITSRPIFTFQKVGSECIFLMLHIIFLWHWFIPLTDSRRLYPYNTYNINLLDCHLLLLRIFPACSQF